MWSHSVVPTGLPDEPGFYPAMNCWAVVGRPAGTLPRLSSVRSGVLIPIKMVLGQSLVLQAACMRRGRQVFACLSLATRQWHRRSATSSPPAPLPTREGSRILLKPHESYLPPRSRTCRTQSLTRHHPHAPRANLPPSARGRRAGDEGEPSIKPNAPQHLHGMPGAMLLPAKA
jgi:hypothetical protein